MTIIQALFRSDAPRAIAVVGLALPMLFACTATPLPLVALGFAGGNVALRSADDPRAAPVAEAPECVAVLPFVAASGTETDHPDQAERVRRAVFSALAPAPVRDIELMEIDRALRPLAPALRRNHAVVAHQLFCATLLLGTVSEYRRRFYGLYSEVAIGADLELIRASDGYVLWHAREVVVKRAGGLPLSPIGAMETVLRTAGQVAGDPFMPVTDELARRLIATFPALPSAGSLPEEARIMASSR